MMNRSFEHIGRDVPYDLPEGSLEALRERIRSRTTGATIGAGARTPTAPASTRLGARRLPLWIAAGTAAAAVVVVAGVFFATRVERTADPSARLEEMLSTAAPETVQRAAAENYDDIFYNQQL